jgi:PAS domain S-box-containing protein
MMLASQLLVERLAVVRGEGVDVSDRSDWVNGRRSVLRLPANRGSQDGYDPYRSIVEATRQALVLFGLDGRVEFVNEQLCALVGSSSDLLLGSDVLGLVHPDDRPRAEVALDPRGPGADPDYELRVRRDDGSSVWTHLTSRPLTNAQGAVYGGFALFRDISPRKQTEHALAASELRNRLIVEEAPVGIGLVGLDGRFVEANDALCALLGRSRDELIGSEVGPLTVAEDFERERPLLEALLGGERERYSIEKRHVCADGSISWGSVSVVLVRDDSGEPIYALGTVQDVNERHRLDDALKASEARSREIIDNAPYGIVLLDLEGCVLEVNPAAGRMLGYSRAEMVGRPCDALTHPDDHGREAPLLRALLEGASDGYTLEKRCLHRNGGAVWGRVTMRLIRDGDGRPRRVLAHLEDAGERRRLDEALRESEERLRTIFEASGSAIVLLDADLRIVEVNPAFERLTGYSAAEARGAEYASVLTPEERPATEEAREAILRVDGVLARERTYLRKDGERFAGYARGTVVRDAAGEPLYFLVLFDDITEQKLAQDRLRSMFDNVPLGVVIGAQDGTILEPNAYFARLLGYTPEELVGRNFRELTHPDDLDTSDRFTAFLAARGDTLQTEKRYLRKDGEPVWVRVTVARISADGQLGTTLVEDLTERRAVEEQLRQAQKLEAVGLLAGAVAHDFNNLLSIVRGYSDLLLQANGLPDELRADLGQIHLAAERGAQLTAQLNAFSRRQLVQTRVLDLNESVLEAAELLGRLLGDDVVVETRLAPDLRPLVADPGELGQVLINLAMNARDAMPAGGRLAIETSRRVLDAAQAEELGLGSGGAFAELAVSDAGHGMDADAKRRLFEPFFTTKAPGRGTGLGLPIVMGIVQRAGGRIDVESEPGEGATFRILLPEAPADATLPPPPVQPPPEPADAPAATVLLAEDNTTVRALVVRMLDRLGFRVLAASSADEALTVCARHDGDIEALVTDVVMPGTSGPELVAAASALRPSMRVLYISGHTDDRLAAVGSLGDEVAFLEKPFTAAELGAKLSALLERPLQETSR